MSQKVLTTAMFLTVILAVFAFSAPVLAQEVITIWHSVPQEFNPLFEQILDTYPSKTSGMVKLNLRRFDTPEQLRKALLEGPEKPDMALVETGWQEEIAKRKPVVLMEDIIREKVGNSVFIVFKMDTFPQMWESSKVGDKLMSMPFAGFNRALIINKNILSKYTTKSPQNLKEIITISLEIINKSKAIGGGMHQGQEWPFVIPHRKSPVEVAEFFQVLLWQTDKDIFEPFMDGELVAFDGPEGRRILTMMVEMIHKHKIVSSDHVDHDKVAMFVGTPSDYLRMKRQGIEVDVIRLPGEKVFKNNLVVYSFLVFKGADEKKMDKIWHTIYDSCEFASSARWALTTHFLPQNKQVTLSPGYFAYIKDYPGIKNFVQQIKNSKVSVMSAKKQKVMQLLGENIIQCLNNRMDVNKCIDSSAEHANMIMDPEGSLRAKKAQMKSLQTYVDKVWEKDGQ